MTICVFYKVNDDVTRLVEIFDKQNDALLYEGKMDLIDPDLMGKDIWRVEPKINLRLYKVTYRLYV